MTMNKDGVSDEALAQMRHHVGYGGGIDGPEAYVVTVDEIAQLIREVDGDNTMGAGQLAEALLGRLVPAALSVRAEPVAVKQLVDLEEAIRLAEVGEYLYNACAYSYGDGRSEPREYGIEWQWQQSRPDEYGQGQLLAAATRWHEEQAEDGLTTEAAKLRSALEASPAAPAPQQAGGGE